MWRAVTCCGVCYGRPGFDLVCGASWHLETRHKEVESCLIYCSADCSLVSRQPLTKSTCCFVRPWLLVLGAKEDNSEGSDCIGYFSRTCRSPRGLNALDCKPFNLDLT